MLPATLAFCVVFWAHSNCILSFYRLQYYMTKIESSFYYAYIPYYQWHSWRICLIWLVPNTFVHFRLKVFQCTGWISGLFKKYYKTYPPQNQIFFGVVVIYFVLKMKFETYFCSFILCFDSIPNLGSIFTCHVTCYLGTLCCFLSSF
jgi:hypothetical protein